MSVDVTNRKALEKWLDKQPREVISGFAARSALRALPVMASLPDIAAHADDIVLSVFRAVALPWVAAKYPTHGKDLAAADAVRAAFAAYDAARAARTDRAAYTAYAAARAVRIAFATARAFYAARAAFAAYAADAARAAACAAAQIDVDSQVKINKPLWFDGNAAMPKKLLQDWQKLKQQLLALDKNWHVWTDWYEARLWPDRFPPPNEKLELARATIPDKDWKKGWQHINPLIERLIEEHTPEDGGTSDEPSDFGDMDVEPQNMVAISFRPGDDDQPIDVDLTAGADQLLTDRDAQDRYDEAKRLAQNFVDNFDRDEPGANQATELLQECGLYLEALGEELTRLRPSLTVTRGDYFRLLLDAQQKQDDLSNLPELSDKHRVALERIVAAHNVMVQLDPELARRDNARLGPDALENLVPPADGQSLIEQAVRDGVATDQVGEIVSEEAANAPAQPDANLRTSRRYSEGVKNFFRTAIAKMWSFTKKYWLKGGLIPPALYGLGHYLLANEIWIYQTFANNPHMITILDKLFDILKSLPLA